MLDMGVWIHVKREDHPNDHRLFGCRWVLKVKRNGVYCARLWEKVSVKSLAWILQTITAQWLMMSYSEVWWQEC